MNSSTKLHGYDVLPPMAAPTPRPDSKRTELRREATQPDAKRAAARRFAILNQFADSSARLVNTTAQACWWILYRETKRDGLATITHQRIAECVGVSRQTATRALGRLERARLLTVVRRGGWQRGTSTYQVHATPKAPST
jgi:DNA-binding transcriptional ArsR family regulator